MSECKGFQSSKVKLQMERINNTISKIRNFLELISRYKLNCKNEKWKKHMPFSEYKTEINDGFPRVNGECIEVQFKNGTTVYSFLDVNNKEFSYSLSMLSQQQHLDIIAKTLNVQINLLEHICKPTLIEYSKNKQLMDEYGDKMYAHIKKETNNIFEEKTDVINESGTNYSCAYYVDIVPPLSFIQNNVYNTCKIANRYIIAIGTDKLGVSKLNIFYDYYPGIKRLYGPYDRIGLLDYINNKNSNNTTFSQLTTLIDDIKYTHPFIPSMEISVLGKNEEYFPVAFSKEILLSEKLTILLR